MAAFPRGDAGAEAKFSKRCRGDDISGLRPPAARPSAGFSKVVLQSTRIGSPFSCPRQSKALYSRAPSSVECTVTVYQDCSVSCAEPLQSPLQFMYFVSLPAEHASTA